MKNVKNANDISPVIIACMSLLVMTAIYVYSCDTNDTLNQLEVPTINQLNNTAQESKYAYDITSVEREMLARLVYREANTESIECQEAIVSVVINRWQDGRWGNTLKEVVYAKNQFSPANLLYCTTPNETNYEAVDEIIQNGCTIPEYVLFFRADYHFKWEGYKAYQKIDSTCFGYMKEDKK